MPVRRMISFDKILGSLYQENPDAIVVYDLDGRIAAANPAMCEMIGHEMEQIVGSHYREHVFRRDLPRIEAAVATALGGGTGHVETTFRHRNGEIIPVECYLFAAREGGELAGVIVLARDIIALRSAEQSLSINQERFRSLFEYHPDGIMSVKANGRISRVNVALEGETGFYGEQVIGRNWTDLVAPECRADAEAAFRLVGRGEATEFDGLLLDRLGNRIDVQMKLVPLRVADTVDGAYVIAKNVAAQRSAERAIAQQSARIRELYLAAATRGESIDDEITQTLALGCRLFGFDFGYVTRVDASTVTIMHAAATGSGGPQPGNISPRAASFSRLLSGDRNTVFIADLDTPPWDSDPAHPTAPWRAYFATRLVVGESEYGGLVFASRKPRESGLADLDRDLIQLMALFVAAALERMQHAVRIEQLAFFDSLTGLPNRVLFADRIRQTMATAKRYQRGFAVMYLDLDNFKKINDRFGHAIGDLALRAVADRLLMILRESDTIARFGGDEFVILQPVIDGAHDASDLARKIVNTMQPPVTIDGNEHSVHASIGIALFPQDGQSAEELMDRADRALYHAKHAGRNRWSFFDEQATRQNWPSAKDRPRRLEAAE